MTMAMTRESSYARLRGARMVWATLFIPLLVLHCANTAVAKPPTPLENAQKECAKIPENLVNHSGWEHLCKGHLSFEQGIRAEPNKVSAKNNHEAALDEYNQALEAFKSSPGNDKTYENKLGMLLSMVGCDQAEAKIHKVVPNDRLHKELLLVQGLQNDFFLLLLNNGFPGLATSIRHIRTKAEDYGGIVKINISSAVDINEIKIDGEYRGRIEHRRSRSLLVMRRSSESSDHEVQVEQPGFVKYQETIHLAKVGESTSWEVKLVPDSNTALLQVDVPGGKAANVYVNGGGSFGRTRCSPTSDTVAPDGGSVAPECKVTNQIERGKHILSARWDDTTESLPMLVDAEAGKSKPITLTRGCANPPPSEPGKAPQSADERDRDCKKLWREAANVITIQTTPSNARIAVDGVTLGLGSWRGQISPGKYKFTSESDGYESMSREVNVPLAGSGPVEFQFNLEKRPVPLPSPDSPTDPRFFIGLFGGGLFGASFGGLDTGGASSGCSITGSGSAVKGGLGGARLEYAPWRALTLGIEVGYLGAWRSVDRNLRCPNVATATYTIHDQLGFQGPFVGFEGSYHIKLASWVTFVPRLTLGVVVSARSSDTLQATVSTPGSAADARVQGTSLIPQSFPFFARPELGLELGGRHLRLGVGLGVQFFPASLGERQFSHRAISVADPRSCTKPADAACARSSSALQNDVAYGAFALFSPELAFVWAP
jgi:hypothetical protein